MAETDLSKYLKTLAKQKISLPFHEIVDLFIQMVQSVDSCHKKGVLHFDLKPANFLRCDGKLKLSDFGIAGVLRDAARNAEDGGVEDKTHVSRRGFAGTTRYMAPEMIHQTGMSGYTEIQIGVLI